jgi:hypothetical protein
VICLERVLCLSPHRVADDKEARSNNLHGLHDASVAKENSMFENPFHCEKNFAAKQDSNSFAGNKQNECGFLISSKANSSGNGNNKTSEHVPGLFDVGAVEENVEVVGSTQFEAVTHRNRKQEKNGIVGKMDTAMSWHHVSRVLDRLWFCIFASMVAVGNLAAATIVLTHFYSYNRADNIPAF